MSWAYKLTERAVKDLRGLSEADRRRIFRYLDERIATEDDPRRFGKALRSDLAGSGAIASAIAASSAKFATASWWCSS